MNPGTGRDGAILTMMIRLHCWGRHSGKGPGKGSGKGPGNVSSPERDGLCAECAALADYASDRLASCRYGARKPFCSRCPTPCYRPAERARIREVMRYAGPRMLWRAPLMFLRHAIRGGKPA
jgi:hypothetical protein